MDSLPIVLLLVGAISIYIVIAFFTRLPPFSTSSSTENPTDGTPVLHTSEPQPKSKPERPTAPLFEGEELGDCLDTIWAEYEEDGLTGREMEETIRNHCPEIETVRFLSPDSIVTMIFRPNRVNIVTEDGTPDTITVRIRHG